MKYIVGTLRKAGLQAKWGKVNGTPMIFARDPSSKLPHQRKSWWLVDRYMFKRMEEVGVKQGFEEGTLLGDIFNHRIYAIGD
jgi:hypothetical protein